MQIRNIYIYIYLFIYLYIHLYAIRLHLYTFIYTQTVHTIYTPFLHHVRSGSLWRQNQKTVSIDFERGAPQTELVARVRAASAARIREC